jgi:hypothetical protein
MNKTKTLSVLAALTATSVLAQPSQDSFHGVTNDWYHANFSNVIELAQSRLASNSNDIVGLTLTKAYNITFGDVNTLSSAITRFLAVADTIPAGSFSNLYWRLRPGEINYRDAFLPTLTEEEILADRPKAFLPKKPIPDDLYLKALWEDGRW